MAVTKKIEIDGKEVTFKASAAVPRLYRIKFGRDIYKDLRQLEKSVGENGRTTIIRTKSWPRRRISTGSKAKNRRPCLYCERNKHNRLVMV